MIPRLTAMLMLALFSSLATGQPSGSTGRQQTSSPQISGAYSIEDEDSHLIEQYESEVRSGETRHESPDRMAKIYADLGTLYADSGMSLKAEDAIRRAIDDLKYGSQQDLAEEVGQLGVLHLAMGKVGRAERDLTQALRVYEKVRDPVGIAITQTELANTYNEQKHFKKGEYYGRRAFETVETRQDFELKDRISAGWALGFALTGLKRCGPGIAILRDTLDVTKSKLPEYGHYYAYSEYVLGFGYWHCEDRMQASEWLERGTSGMKDDFGWSRKIYLNAMSHYARFLREIGNLRAADSAEAVVHQSEAVVDVRELSGRTEGFRFCERK